MATAMRLTAAASGVGSFHRHNPPAGLIKERENQGLWNSEWVHLQAKMDSVYKKKVVTNMLPLSRLSLPASALNLLGHQFCCLRA